MKKHENIIFAVFLCSILFYIFFIGDKLKLASIEDLDIYEGLSVGIDKNEVNIQYRLPVSASTYKEDESYENIINTGIGSTIGQTREDRQRKIGRRFFLGLNRVCLIEEECATYGIRPIIDIEFKNPIFNDSCFLVVCKGKSEAYLAYNSLGYDNSATYISDMVKNSPNYNFFNRNYNLKNVFLSMDAEGRNIVCPYIEKNADGIEITGMAVFVKDKLAAVLNIKDARVMNMLRENKVKGILTILNESGEYINYEAKSKRKITVKKIGDKYDFVIDLNLDGDIINNTLYKNLSGNIDVTKKFEEDMSKQVEKMCMIFLDKMKNEYKVDCLQLGWIAAAKYGRDTGADWNKVVSNSDIKVNVKVHVNKVGRGQY